MLHLPAGPLAAGSLPRFVPGVERTTVYHGEIIEWVVHLSLAALGSKGWTADALTPMSFVAVTSTNRPIIHSASPRATRVRILGDGSLLADGQLVMGTGILRI